MGQSSNPARRASHPVAPIELQHQRRRNEDELGCCTAQGGARLTSMELRRRRNLVSVSGWAKHGILYEWVSLESLQKNFTTEKIPRSRQAVNTLVHAPSSPSVGERIWPPAGDA